MGGTWSGIDRGAWGLSVRRGEGVLTRRRGRLDADENHSILRVATRDATPVDARALDATSRIYGANGARVFGWAAVARLERMPRLRIDPALRPPSLEGEASVGNDAQRGSRYSYAVSDERRTHPAIPRCPFWGRRCSTSAIKAACCPSGRRRPTCSCANPMRSRVPPGGAAPTIRSGGQRRCVRRAVADARGRRRCR